MDVYMGFAVGAVLLAGGAVTDLIRHWGSGFHARDVRCPLHDQRAIISSSCVTLVGEDGRASIERDVLQCSLLPGQPVNCDKRCLAQL